MSEPAKRIEQPEPDTSFDHDVDPRSAVHSEGQGVAELSPTPEQLVDLGDGSLTLDALVIARDALILQTEELRRRLELYERAIQTWGEPRESVPSERKVAGSSGESQAVSGAHAIAQPKRESQPAVVDVPSMIVCMEELMPLELSPPTQIEAPVHTRIRRRDHAKTQRLSTTRPRLRSGVVWMLGIGLVLGGLTIWAGRSVSLASSGKPRKVDLALPLAPAATVEVAPSPLPLVQQLTAPAPAPAPHAAPSSIVMSHFELVWGDTSVRRLRAALKRAIAKMNGCFEEQPGMASALPPTLELSVRLREDGSITWVKGLRDIDASPVQSCIAKAIHRADYPESRSGLLVNTELTFKGR